MSVLKGKDLMATILLLFVPIVVSARHGHGHRSSQPSMRQNKVIAQSNLYWERRPILKRVRGADTLQTAGSSLPDCSHACGSCSPCRLVMVSFVCASIAEAETCPMAYKCMCHYKSYPVP
ncbi:protein EPIDERMAL PATTERNING FACTOR 1-like [Tripterygium wilfordii]|uniref:Epidermal patterning factor-like protein n=1 Tax=Tripterygium wilfordii TaxID=458696 RepID=A0A7J7BXH2_TRIWF|nr:protein EPIDERMAL PATTERNING FACTOR 1-like [Tripterygium wilfordii]